MRVVDSPPLLLQGGEGGTPLGSGGVTRLPSREVGPSHARTAPPQWQTALLDEIDALLPPSRSSTNGVEALRDHSGAMAHAVPDPAMAALMRRIADM